MSQKPHKSPRSGSKAAAGTSADIRSRRRLAYGGLAAVLVLGLVGGGYAWRSSRDHQAALDAATKASSTTTMSATQPQSSHQPGKTVTPVATPAPTPQAAASNDATAQSSRTTAPTIAAQSLAIIPSTATVSTGSTVAVTIYENSGSDAVNTVQATLNYDASRLQYVSLAEAGNFDLVAATDTAAAGQIRLARAKRAAPLTGTRAVVTINFKVKSRISGTANLNLDTASSLLVRSGDTTNILKTTSGASYRIR